MWRGAFLCIALTGCTAFGAAKEGDTPEAGATAPDGGADGNGGTAVDASADVSPKLPGSGSDKLVFVSKGLTPITLGFVAAANNLCNMQGKLKRPNATFVAWLSSSTVEARDGLPNEGMWKLANGTDVVFRSRADIFAGAVKHEIDEHADGSTVPMTYRVWTNSTSNGMRKYIDPAMTCADFTMPNVAMQARVGNPYAKNTQWTDDMDIGCTQSAAFVCFEQ